MKNVYIFVFTIIVLLSKPAISAPLNPNAMYLILNRLDIYPHLFHSLYLKSTSVTHTTPEYERMNGIKPENRSHTQILHEIYSFKNHKIYMQSQHSADPNTILKEWIINNQDYNQVKGKARPGSPYTITGLSAIKTSSNGVSLYHTNMFLASYMDGGKWYSDIIRSGSSQLSRILPDSTNGAVYIITIQSPIGTSTDKRTNTELWLAKKYGYAAVKLVADYNSSGTHYVNTYLFKNYKHYDQIWFPNDYVYTYSIVSFESNKILMSTYGHLNQLSINNVPESVFNIDLPPNSRFDNQETGVTYRIGANGKLVPVEMNSPPPSITLLQKMPHWLFLISLFVMILIGLDAFQRWFRKRSRSS
jgi:hypothetical protein